MERLPQAMGRRVNIAELDEDRGFRDQGGCIKREAKCFTVFLFHGALGPGATRRCVDFTV